MLLPLEREHRVVAVCESSAIAMYFYWLEILFCLFLEIRADDEDIADDVLKCFLDGSARLKKIRGGI